MADAVVKEKLLTDSNWINKTQNILQENVMSLFEKFYQGAHDLVYSSATTTAIMVIVCFWLLNILKNGYPTRDEMFKAVKYIIILAIIFATLSSFNAYTGALYFLTIPENIITSIVSTIFESKDFGGIITESANRVDNLRSIMWNYGVTTYIESASFSIMGISFSAPGTETLAVLAVTCAMIPFWIFYIIFFIVLIGLTIVIFFSKFMAFLILSTFPLVLPFLIFTRFLPYMWSWYKLYLSFAFIAPLAFIVLNLAMNPILELEKFTNANVADLFTAQFEYLITGTITCITAIFIMKKIPNWINAVLGTQMEAGSGGVAGGAVAGAVVGKTIMGGFARSLAGGSFLKGLASGFGGATGTSMLGRATASIGKGITQDIATIGKNIKKFKGGVAVP